MKNLRNIRGRLSDSSLAVVVNMLEHRPNIWDSARQSFIKERFNEHNALHYIFSRGFELGYRHAVKRLKKQIK